MELELGLKVTKTRENLTSTDFQITKDRAGLLFISRETETMFILTAHLKGFRRKRIKIEISKDGTRIEISGDKPIQEMVMVKWIMYKKEVEIKGFRKVFRIPDGVVLDRIKAKFNEEDSILSIFMPKSIKGILGIGVEELTEEEVNGESSEKSLIEAEEIPEKDLIQEVLRPESEQKQIVKEKESDPVGETSSETSEIDFECERESNPVGETSLETSEIDFECERETDQITPTDPGREIEEPKEVESDKKLHQSNTSDVLQFEEIQQEKPLEIPEQIKTQEISNLETKTPEQESQEHDYGSESVKSMETEPDQVFNQPKTPDEHQTQEIREETKITEQESQKQEDLVTERSDRCPENVSTEPDQELHPSETPNVDHLQDQKQIGDQEIQREEIREEETEVQDEGEESDLGFNEIEELNEEETARSESAPSIQTPPRKSRFCGPCIFAGSAFIGFLIVLVMQLVRKNKKIKKY